MGRHLSPFFHSAERTPSGMAETVPTKTELLTMASAYYKEKFNNEEPTVAAAAPGRVNMIGEHTDYNNGFVFPMALPMVTVLVGKPNNSSHIHLYSMADSLHEPNYVTFRCPEETKLVPNSPKWANYCKGVIAKFNGKVPGFNAVIITSVPVGGGVSSSASLEVATYSFLEALTGTASDQKEKALICQKAEHEFANMPCGIMDQLASVCSVENSILLIDCESYEVKPIYYDEPNLVVMIINSRVKHKLSGSEYPTRRKQCFDAAAAMKISSLREADLNMLKEHKHKMEPVVYRRARHVITEISRTLEAVRALMDKNFQAFGYLMLQSHNSLKFDFEVSCDELDDLVDIAMKVKGVYGSRMTGGGFGGCTVTLLDSKAVPELITKTKENFNGSPIFYIVTPSSGSTNETVSLKDILHRTSTA